MYDSIFDTIEKALEHKKPYVTKKQGSEDAKGDDGHIGMGGMAYTPWSSGGQMDEHHLADSFIPKNTEKQEKNQEKTESKEELETQEFEGAEAEILESETPENPEEDFDSGETDTDFAEKLELSLEPETLEERETEPLEPMEAKETLENPEADHAEQELELTEKTESSELNETELPESEGFELEEESELPEHTETDESPENSIHAHSPHPENHALEKKSHQPGIECAELSHLLNSYVPLYPSHLPKPDLKKIIDDDEEEEFVEKF